MDQLNSDCLKIILSYIPLKERIKLERVCSLWRSIMPYHDFHVLNDAFDILTFPKWKSHHTVRVRHGPCAHCDEASAAYIVQNQLLEALSFFLSRFGKTLKQLSFNSSCHLACLVTPEIIGVIRQYCSSSVGLDLSRSLVLDSALKALSDGFKLRSLMFDYCTVIDSEQFFVVDGCTLISEVISKSATNLQMLELRGVKSARQQLPKLERAATGRLTKLVLTDCYVTSADLESIFHWNQRSLKRLEISSCMSIVRFDSIAQLENLAQIYLRQAMISVEDFESICRSCKSIDRLHLEMCPRLTDLNSVKQLKSTLVHLSVLGRSMRIDDDLLEALVSDGGSVRTFEIVDCSVSDETFRRMIPSARGVTLKIGGTGIRDSTIRELMDCGNRVMRLPYF